MVLVVMSGYYDTLDDDNDDDDYDMIYLIMNRDDVHWIHLVDSRCSSMQTTRQDTQRSRLI